ncbi:MAG: hypothetical protein V3U87_08140 [Methylococcaceae bacterium]
MNAFENKHFAPSFEVKFILNERNKYNVRMEYEYLGFDKHGLDLSSKTNHFVIKALYSIRLRLWNIALNQRGGIRNFREIP